jgi:hypothetical protein
MRPGSRDRKLPAHPGARRNPNILQGQGQQTGGYLFAAGDDDVIFPSVRQFRRLIAVSHKLIRRPRHGRHHDGYLISRSDLPLYPGGNMGDAFHICD